MKCPVPGCSNDNLNQASLYCVGCGLLTIDLKLVETFMAWWRFYCDSPRSFYKDPAVSNGDFTFFFEENENAPDNLLNHKYNYFYETYYSTVRGFRVGHPIIRFFRCWNCDLRGDQEQPPLLPPEKFAHSTLFEGYLLGRPSWGGWSLYDQCQSRYKKLLERREGKIEVIQTVRSWAPPIDLWEFRKLRGLTCSIDRSKELQSDAIALNERHLANLNFELSLIDNELSEARIELEKHPQRPHATQHNPCPVCNSSFPFILRHEGNVRHSIRTVNNYNVATTSIEKFLIGDETKPDEFDELPWSTRRRKAIEYSEKCGVKINMMFLQVVQGIDGYQWSIDEFKQ